MASSRSRIHALDELRGFCLILMIVFHAFYTLGYMFSLPLARDLFHFFAPAEPLFAGIFIALCGFSCRLSRNNLKRGLLLSVVSVALTAATYAFSAIDGIGDVTIWFGVLHCLSVCILLFTLLKKPLSRIPTWLGLILTAVLFTLTFGMLEGYVGVGAFAWHFPTEWLANQWLAPLGIGFLYSADFFPVFPWFFCFLFGAYLGNYKAKLPKWTRRQHLRPLAFLGRHSLWVYLVHQPIIFGIAYAIDLII